MDSTATVAPIDPGVETGKNEPADVEKQAMQVEAPPKKEASNNTLFIVLGVVAAVVLIAVVVVVLVVVVFDDDSSSSSTTATGTTATTATSTTAAGSAMSSVRVNMMSTSTASRRSNLSPVDKMLAGLRRKVNKLIGATSARRAYDSVGTNYSDYQTPEEVDVPGSDGLGTVNTIICFVASTGLTNVDPTSAPYLALADMAPCKSGERTSKKEIFEVTIGGPDNGLPSWTTNTTANGTEISFDGYCWFNMNSASVKLTAQAAFTLKTVASDATCEGIPIDGAPTGQQWCWTGGVKWKEDGIMDGFFEGSYDSTSATPAKIQFYEVMASGETESLLYMSNADETNTMTKVGGTNDQGGTEYYCLNGDATKAKISKASTADAACAATSSICLSKSSVTYYPFALKPFDSTTGAEAGDVDAVYGLQLKYSSGTSKECYAGLDGSGAFMSCGMGEASSADMIAEGGTATNQEGTTSYTVHHSNSMIRKYKIKSLTITEFAAAYYMSYFVWVNTESKFYQYILQYNSDPLIFKIAYKRYHAGQGWTDFVADGTNTYTLSSSEHGIQACWQNAKYYTGDQKPTSGREDFVFSHDWVYDGVSKVLMQEEAGLLQPSADLDLVCASYCKEKDTNSGACWESAKCPKQSWSGLTLGTNTEYTYSADTAYKYKWKISDVNLYTETDNSGNAIAATVIDARTGVTYDSDNQWSETAQSEMFPGTDATTYNTAAKVAAYKKVDGNVFYKVGVGMKGGYEGWSFYAKTAGAFVTLADPLSCEITMSTAADANGGSSYNGAKFALAFYGSYTNGLKFEKISLGNSAVGTNEEYVPSPQIANGAVCGDYVLKSQYTMIVPVVLADGDCSFTMTDPGTLPTAAVAPGNAAVAAPTTDKMCYAGNALLQNVTGCALASDVAAA